MDSRSEDSSADVYQIQGLRFNGLEFRGIKFSRLDLSGIEFSELGLKFSGIELPNSTQVQRYRVGFSRLDLRGIEFRKLDFRSRN